MDSRLMIVVAIALVSGCSRAATPAHFTQGGPAPSVWTADFIRTEPGQLDRYLRYVDANWARSRRTVLAQGGIRSFRVLVTSPTESAPWDLILLTEYPDSATHARREGIFRPVMEAQDETLIDGLSGRGPDNPLKTTVASALLTTAMEGQGVSED